jgi:hypothetical protein
MISLRSKAEPSRKRPGLRAGGGSGNAEIIILPTTINELGI